MEYKGILFKTHYLVQLEIWIDGEIIETVNRIWTPKELENKVAIYKHNGYSVQLILTAPYTYKMVVSF